MSSNCQLLIIGAGAAGIGAAHAALQAGLDYIIVEASHRVGGRGLTEELAPGIPWDLGCHWLHSGSINPLVSVADRHGINYEKDLQAEAFICMATGCHPTMKRSTARSAIRSGITSKHWMRAVKMLHSVS